MTEETPDITALRARVQAMRDLGVTRWGDIELGPVPGLAASEEDVTQRSLKLEAEEKARREALRFRASGGPKPAGVRT